MSEAADMARELKSRGLNWDALLYCDRESPGVVLYEADPAGRRIAGTGQVVSLHTTGDPVWCPRGETERRYIGEFEPGHRLHLYRFLLRQARSAAFSVTLAWGSGPLGPSGDMACDAFERMEEEMWDRPKSWMVTTPFMMALGALILGDGHRAELELIHKTIEAEEERKERWV